MTRTELGVQGWLIRAIALLATVATACMSSTHYRTNLAADSRGDARACLAQCRALHGDDDGSYARCFRACPGVVHGHGRCDRARMSADDVCTERRSGISGAGAALLGFAATTILIGVIAAHYGVLDRNHNH